MSIHHLVPAESALDARVAENVNTLCHRARMSGRQLAEATGINRGTLARKMRGGVWHLTEVVTVAAYFGVTLEEMTTSLPDRETWEARRAEYAIRDSNPEPAD